MPGVGKQQNLYAAGGRPEGRGPRQGWKTSGCVRLGGPALAIKDPPTG